MLPQAAHIVGEKTIPGGFQGLSLCGSDGQRRNHLVSHTFRWLIYCTFSFFSDDVGLTLTARQQNLYTNLPIFFPDLHTHRGTD